MGAPRSAPPTKLITNSQLKERPQLGRRRQSATAAMRLLSERPTQLVALAATGASPMPSRGGNVISDAPPAIDDATPPPHPAANSSAACAISMQPPGMAPPDGGASDTR